MNHICPSCQSIFSYKSRLLRHAKGRRRCSTTMSRETLIDKINQDDYNIYNTKMREDISSIARDVLDTKEHVSKLVEKEGSGNTTINNNNNNTHHGDNITRQQMVLNFLQVNNNSVPLGKEDTSVIPMSVRKAALKNISQAPTLMLNSLHSHPENRNVALKNKTDKACMAKITNDAWQLTPVQDIVKTKLGLVQNDLYLHIADRIEEEGSEARYTGVLNYLNKATTDEKSQESMLWNAATIQHMNQMLYETPYEPSPVKKISIGSQVIAIDPTKMSEQELAHWDQFQQTMTSFV